MATKKHDNIADLLDIRAKELEGSFSLGGPSLLTFPTHNDSARMIMFNSHINQRAVLNNTEFPRVFGNFENIVGEYSTYNNRSKANYEIIHIIDKFPDVESGKDIQKRLVFVRNLDTGMYDVIERNDVEDLTEKYGFQYDNSGINQFGIGDTIPKGANLSRPTSYDEYNNYGFGRNIKFMYLIDDDTIEDAIVVSESLSKLMESTEVEEVKVSINDNDILINYYGDDDHYLAFPNIGEHTKNKILCVKRRINSNQILFDLKASNTKRILNNTDMKSYMDGTVVDIEIYSNKPREELVNANFNKQLLHYLDMNQAFYENIKEFTQSLIDGYPDKCTQNVRYWNKRSKQLTDPDFKHKDESGSAFGNIVMYFTLKRVVGLGRGQKLTGRYGNKGVISKVKPDYLMPHTETGDRVDIIFNSLGVYNRLNVFQLFEQSINFITDNLVRRMKEPDCNLKECETLFFKVLDIFNPEEKDIMQQKYRETCKLKTQKEEFFEIVKEHGIYIHIKPFWHMKNLYDAIQEAYVAFPFIKPYKTYFYEENSQRWCRMLHDQIIGSMYVMKLKQNSKKNLSVCSNAPINRHGIPEKTDSAKKHRSLNPRTPIRSGLQETINNIISISPEDSAKLHMFYRSSPVARRELGKEILDKYGKGLPIDPKVTDLMSNRNVEIFAAYMKIMGLESTFDQDEIDFSKPLDQPTIHKYNDITYLATPDYMKKEIARDVARKRVDGNELGYIYIGEDGMKRDEYINEMALNVEAELNDEGEDWFDENF